LAKRKEYELAIKIAGKIDASLRRSGNLSIKELNKIAREASKTSMMSKDNWGKAINDIDKGLNKIGSVAKKAFDVVSNAAKIGAVAITGVVAASTKVGMDFEKQMKTVQAISGAGSEDLKILSDKAKEMGENTVFSATEAGKAMEYMAMAGWKTSDMLGGIEGIMNLAAASGEDLAMVSDIVTDDLTAFGLAADQAGRFSDVLAAASSNSNTNVAMMGETFKYAAPIAGALGYTIEDTALAIGLMANNGIKGSMAGTQLRRMFTNLTGGVELVSKSFGKMAIKTANADGSMRPLNDVLKDLKNAFGQMSEQEQNANAKTIAGQQAMSGLLAIVNSSEKDWNKLSNAINNSAGAAQRMAETRLDNLAGDVKLAESALEGLGIKIYEDLKVPMRESVQLFAQGISGITDWAKSSGFVQRISDFIVKTLPTARRILLETGEGMFKFFEPIIKFGEWNIKNPNIITSVLKGIVASFITLKAVTTGASIIKGIQAIILAFTNPVTGFIVVASLVVGGIVALTSAFNGMRKELGRKSLEEHFGNISLSLKDIDEVAKALVDNGTLSALRKGLESFDEAGQYLDDFTKSAKMLEKLNWKVEMGIFLSEVDKQKYIDSANEMASGIGEAVLSEQYAMNINLSLLTDNTESYERIKQQFDEFYNGTYAELTELGTELNEVVNQAFNDGILDIDESKHIAEIQKQMADIKSKLAASEFEAGLEVLNKSTIGKLDKDSFMNLVDASNKKATESIEQYSKAYEKLLSSSNIQLKEGTITSTQYDANAKEFAENYKRQQMEVLSKTVSSLHSAVAMNYSKEFEYYIPQVNKTIDNAMNESMGDTFARTFWEDNTVGAVETLKQSIMGNVKIDSATKEAMKQLWEQLKPQQEQLMMLAREYTAAGKAIPDTLAKALHDSATTGMLAGDESSMWYLVGERAKNDPAYTKFLLELYEKGYAIPDEVIKGLNANNEINNAGKVTWTAFDNAFRNAFKNPFNLQAKVNVETVYGQGYAILSENARIKKANEYQNKVVKGVGFNNGIPGFANGGIIEKPTFATFAENGPEVAIPLDGSDRSISLWRKSGELLGAFSGKSRAESNLERLSTSTDSSLNISFAPVLNFSGNTDKEIVRNATDELYGQFKGFMKKYTKELKRVSFT